VCLQVIGNVTGILAQVVKGRADCVVFVGVGLKLTLADGENNTVPLDAVLPLVTLETHLVI
jgi:hypothetical protein